ncbi:MAG: DUF2163 domain-containing protein [Bosea sp. (in: a-proteobacteria)]|uniref:DUF2163 domain-containing protein n=1 Tax=Bosea sp. (in: a-proteobacteria) TaxID=1871050 RepID=UPI002736B37C|nr:DUF2163 domain-containing protein [Bosea sp. (in: a-proteobacteria)]MDP3257601.1 DUF2163 domain-containing protein [Bosea sp. (in: a-proteobacteria)]MDP3320095.1 DUF2163 domain-containing protein [Bosea sp. (in: a-proteobacteria)]
MRAIPEALAEHMAQGATTLCRCWSLTRRDGLVLGFTDHDGPLVFEGVTFAAATGLEAAETSAELGFAVGGGDVSGALAASGVNEGDLARGLYDDARVTLWLVNWADPTQRLRLDTGFVGEVRRSDGAFTAEVRGLAKAFDEERGRLYLRSCSADLGDARCGVSLVPAEAAVTMTDGRLSLTAAALAAFADGYLTGGRLVFTGGNAVGFTTEVKRHAASGTDASLELWQASPAEIRAGDPFSVTPGCDKSFTTCRARFGNGVNFRGFPHIPGNDFIIGGVRPGDGALDGGSLFR